MSPDSAPSLRHSTFVRYMVSLLTVTGAVLVTAALRSINPRIPIPESLVFCAAIFSGWFGGIGPGLLAALISSAAIILHFLPAPSGGSVVLSEVPRMVIFSMAVFFVSWISGRQRRAEELLEQARDELEQKVQERTAELKRTNEELQQEIAEKKVAEEALHLMQAELTHVSRVTMMGELTASIAHEVNQPLGAIMNYGNACRRLLAAGETTANIDQALTNIVEDARRASGVIARVRALSQKKPTKKVSSMIKDLIDDVLAIARHEMLRRGVVIRVDLPADLPRLLVDRIQMQQVLLNLIINGMEAMEVVTPKNRVIEINARSVRSAGDFACTLCIRDHGTGVEQADEGHLFEPFYTTKTKGMGMGLAISRSIIECHGGSLSLIPSNGAGATFQILLPVMEATEP